MYGNLHLPPNSTAISITEFKGSDIPGTSVIGIDNKTIYTVPKNATFLSIFLVGGGGSGGRPAVGVGIAGAGGGGSGAIVNAIVPTMLLPSSLWVSVSNGSLGASANATNGLQGEGSCVLMYALPTGAVAVGNILLIANGGGQGISTGTGGAAGTVMTSSLARWSTLAFWNSQVGVAGGAGATGAGVAVAFNATLPLTGGGGGSGSTTAAIGGGITAQAGYLGIPTILGGALGGGAGFAGMGTNKPWGGCGGTGGGSIAGAGVGGAGGNAGWYGCGGGGGGNAQTTSGNGGNGGPGYCLIVAF